MSTRVRVCTVAGGIRRSPFSGSRQPHFSIRRSSHTEPIHTSPHNQTWAHAFPSLTCHGRTVINFPFAASRRHDYTNTMSATSVESSPASNHDTWSRLHRLLQSSLQASTRVAFDGVPVERFRRHDSRLHFPPLALVTPGRGLHFTHDLVVQRLRPFPDNRCMLLPGHAIKG